MWPRKAQNVFFGTFSAIIGPSARPAAPKAQRLRWRPKCRPGGRTSHFYAHFRGSVAPIACIGALMGAQWLGNIRQLEHEIERAIILTDDGELIGTNALSVGAKKQAAPAEGDMVIPSAGPLKSVIADFEKKVIERRLDIFGGNRSRTSESLSISRQALQTKLAKWKQADSLQAESELHDAGISSDQE